MRYLHGGLLLIILALTGLMLIAPVHAEDDGPVQVITGNIETGSILFYTLPDLTQGDTLYVYVSGESGNLDPFIGLTDTFYDSETVLEDFLSEVDRAISQGRDPLEAITEIADGLFLAWDDDSGAGYDAALELHVAANRSYQLLVSSTPWKATFGDSKTTFGNYKLTVGLNHSAVLTGNAEPTGDIIAFYDASASGRDTAVQEISGTLTTSKTSTFFFLTDIEPGNTLYVYAEGTSGDLRPQITLKDFGDKPLRSGNFGCNQTTSTLQYAFDEHASNYKLSLSSCSNNQAVTIGDYRLLVGLNAPEVLTGNAVSTGRPLLRQPITVHIGLQMDQITDVNQKEENFSIVASLRMEWKDPEFAYSPDTCQCSQLILKDTDINDYVAGRDLLWPEFTLFNQQDRRWTQNQLAVLAYDGSVIYFERFTVKIQAPNFDFRKYPYDTQIFDIAVDLLIPEEYFIYAPLEGFSAVGTQLGEERWIVTGFVESISSQDYGSRYSFIFNAKRNTGYFLFRLWIPLGVIISVAWLSFFLKEYVKRIEITAGNLLLFIAFNFTIGSDLPQLGYITFADSIMMITFIISALAIAFNVFLWRLAIAERRALAERIDRYTIWIYPLAYASAFGLFAFFVL